MKASVPVAYAISSPEERGVSSPCWCLYRVSGAKLDVRERLSSDMTEAEARTCAEALNAATIAGASLEARVESARVATLMAWRDALAGASEVLLRDEEVGDLLHRAASQLREAMHDVEGAAVDVGMARRSDRRPPPTPMPGGGR